MSSTNDDQGRATLEAELEELDQKVKHLTTMCRAAKGVVRTLGGFMQDGGEIPGELALAIGGCLMDHVDCAGESADPELQRLLEECDKVIGS